MASHEILLITRLRTLNKGNQALSAAWLTMLQRAFPSTPVRVLERRPHHLVQYTLRAVAKARDPVAAFDAIVTRLARMAPGPTLVGGSPPPARILLDETVAPPVRFVGVRRRLNLRGRLAAAGWYADDYRRRLSACQRARLVVVNPAGEFFPREPQAAFYHLLDAAVAHALGRPTAIVNHTMDIVDPTLRAIIPALYRKLALVGFRDDKSIDAFRAMGGDVSNVLVTPDLALITEIARRAPRRERHVAVAINVPEATAGGYLDRWHAVIAGLRTAGFKLVLVSNELPADQPFYAQIRARFPDIPIEGAGLDHDRYGELLGGFDLVVTSRMHTGVLAMVAGTPVVAVEGSSFKITGLFKELGFAQPVVTPGGGDWPDRVLAQVREVHGERERASAEVADKIEAVRGRIASLLVPRLQAVAQRSP
jgi:polysaccharide pyruvyl transferase WcaK-like protein